MEYTGTLWEKYVSEEERKKKKKEKNWKISGGLLYPLPLYR